MTTASEWATPATRPGEIEHIISGVDRYNPQNLTALSEYLSHQLETGEYDCLANLAILKLFQFNPADFDYSIVISVLLKALTAAPFPDFNLCIALLGEAPVDVIPQPAAALPEEASEEEKAAAAEENAKAQAAPSAGHLSDPLMARLAQLSSLLLSARFRAFWEAYKSQEYQDVRQHAANVNGFEDAVRRVALHSVKSAFTQISTDRLGSYLDLSGNELATFMKTQSEWRIEGDKVRVPINADNEVKATVIREDIQLDQLTKFLSQAQTPVLRAA